MGVMSLPKGGFELGLITSKNFITCLTPYVTATVNKHASFVIMSVPTRHWRVQLLLCQQGGLFSLSVNRHSLFGTIFVGDIEQIR